MTTTDGRPSFERDVFPTELDEIRRRRFNADDLRPLAEGTRLTVRHGPDTEGISSAHHAVGTIVYRDGEQGIFHYLKLSTSGDEPEYLRDYRFESPAFPHESTSDQFFDETPFEAYRALGRHVAEHYASVASLAAGII